MPNGSDDDYSDSPVSDSEEHSEDYRPGGYHPVAKGDTFKNGRYVVLTKLGWGHFSTVWLVHDEETGSQAALKVVKSAEHYTAAARDEVSILSHIRQEDRTDSKHCCRMIDTFEHQGPHGRHVCMVFEVLGDNLLGLIRHYDHEGIPLEIVKKLCREILEGLEFLHDTCKVIHTDLKPENVMLKGPLKRSQELEIAQAVQSYARDPVAWKSQRESQRKSKLELLLASGKPLNKNQKRKIKRKLQKLREERGCDDRGGGEGQGSGDERGVGGSERRSVDLSLQLEGLDVDDDVPIKEKVMGMECKIVDFGNACWVNKHFTEEIQTRQYRSPEVRMVNDPEGHQVSSRKPNFSGLRHREHGRERHGWLCDVWRPR